MRSGAPEEKRIRHFLQMGEKQAGIKLGKSLR